jgi:signal transduction histidine kinase
VFRLSRAVRKVKRSIVSWAFYIAISAGYYPEEMKSSLRLIYSLIVFIIGIVLLSVLTVLFFYENRQAEVSLNLVNHSNVVRYSLERAFSALKDAESAHRGYLLTNDSSFLHSYPSEHTFTDHFYFIDSLVAGDKVQAENVKILKKLFEERLQRLETVSEAVHYAPGKTVVAYRILKADDNVMDTVRQLVNHMLKIESTRLEQRQAYAKRHSILPTVIGIAVSIFSIITFILAFYFTNAELKKSNALNNELENKNLQLEKYTKELSSFTHITSHDMQEPLRKVEFFISMIEEHDKHNLSAEGRKYFDKIRQSIGRMRQLFVSILDFSLANEVKAHIETVDLNDVLNETLHMLKVYIRDTQAVIEREELPKVKGIRYQLNQLFEHLITNALKYRNPNVTPEISISSGIVEGKATGLRELKKDVLYYKISFHDNGVGFDQKYADKIFEMFQRLHVKNNPYGVGMGLPICRKIAHNHQGTLVAHSVVNRGSEFSLYLPVGDV